MTNRRDTPTHPTRRAVLAAMAGGMTTLAGCGGGVGADVGGAGAGGGADLGGGAGPGVGPVDASIAGISSGGTGSFTTGTVSGLGSIIVRGIRFDDGAAIVERDDDGAVGPLLPGMVVSIRGSGIAAATGPDALPTATALRIRYASEWVGKVDAVDAANRTLTVLGQRIDVASNAVFAGDATQLAALTPSHFVEVHGFLDLATGRLLATRVEASNSPPPALRLSGQVSGLDAGARTFRLGTAVIGYDAALVLPAGWADGQLVRVTLATAQAGGTWQATRIGQRESLLPEMEIQDRSEARIEGAVTSLGGAATFAVNGIAIDATGVAIDGVLALGATVEVRGTTVDDVVQATQVDVRTREALETAAFEFIGAISNLNILTRTFTLKGLEFTYGLAVRIDVLGWLTGATPVVRVKATQVNGVWVASEIRQR